MVEDAKTVEKRRLAEALRANLKRRKTAAMKGAQAAPEPTPERPATTPDGRQSKG